MSSTSANTDENTRPPAIVLSDVDKRYSEGAAAEGRGPDAGAGDSRSGRATRGGATALDVDEGSDGGHAESDDLRFERVRRGCYRIKRTRLSGRKRERCAT